MEAGDSVKGLKTLMVSSAFIPFCTFLTFLAARRVTYRWTDALSAGVALGFLADSSAVSHSCVNARRTLFPFAL